MRDYTTLEGVKKKGDEQNLDNKKLQEQIINARDRKYLTDTAHLYIKLITENLAKKKHYKCIEDKEDCI